ncbi:MAG: hypothetical protein LBQ28_06430 [Prevotellaceae bacterium]|nr:hypothetical protein [Prevotellaceae bacterium]
MDVSKCLNLENLDASNCKLLANLYCNYNEVNVITEGCDALSLPNSMWIMEN